MYVHRYRARPERQKQSIVTEFEFVSLARIVRVQLIKLRFYHLTHTHRDTHAHLGTHTHTVTLSGVQGLATS